MVVDAAVVDQGERILHAAPRAVGREPVVVARLLEVVGLGRVGPPGIHAHAVEMGQMAPVNVARLGVESVVRHHALPAGPGVEGVERADFLQFAVLRRPGPEAGPHAYHQMSVIAVHVVHHLFGALQPRRLPCGQAAHVGGQVFLPLRVAHLIDIVRVHKAHGVPVGVAAPVLPVLHNTVERQPSAAELVEHRGQLVARFVAFAALPVAHGPEREHRGAARKLSYSRDDAVLRAVAIEEIIVHAGRHLAGEDGAARGRRVGPARASGVVPVEAVALFAGQVGDGDVGVVVPELHVAAAPVHRRVAQLAHSVDCFVGFQRELLAHGVLAAVHGMGAGRERGRPGAQQGAARAVGKGDGSVGQVQRDADAGRLQRQPPVGLAPVYAAPEALSGLGHDGITLLLSHPAAGPYAHADDGGRVELDAHCAAVQLLPAAEADALGPCDRACGQGEEREDEVTQEGSHHAMGFKNVGVAAAGLSSRGSVSACRWSESACSEWGKGCAWRRWRRARTRPAW